MHADSDLPLLEARALRKKVKVPFALRRRIRAFDLAASLQVRRGETIALLGPNGAGKTTLLRLLAGIYPAGEGSLVRRGTCTGVITYVPAFSGVLTVREHLETHACLDSPPVDVEEALEFTGLRKHADGLVGWLSTGERVRLALAPGLLRPADVYLIDEGLAVCDLEFRTAAIRHLRGRAAAGAAVVLAGHDLLSARALCTRGIVLEAGRVVADADVDTAITRYTAGASAARDARATVSDVEILSVEVVAAVEADEAIAIRTRILPPEDPFRLVVAVKEFDGTLRHGARTLYPGGVGGAWSNRSIELDTVVPPHCLAPGRYTIAVAITDPEGAPLAACEQAGDLCVTGTHAP